MKLHFSIVLACATLTGCAHNACQQTATSGLQCAGPTMAAGPQATASEAIPALSLGWKTVSFCIPKPQLLAVPKPQRGPQFVGIPIMASAAPMAAMPMGMPQQQYVQTVAQPQGAPVQPQSAPAEPQGRVEPQSTPQCAPQCVPGCAEGCDSQAQVMSECDALMQDIGRLQRQISIQAGGGKACLNATE